MQAFSYWEGGAAESGYEVQLAETQVNGRADF